MTLQGWARRQSLRWWAGSGGGEIRSVLVLDSSSWSVYIGIRGGGFFVFYAMMLEIICHWDEEDCSSSNLKVRVKSCDLGCRLEDPSSITSTHVKNLSVADKIYIFPSDHHHSTCICSKGDLGQWWQGIWTHPLDPSIPSSKMFPEP